MRSMSANWASTWMNQASADSGQKAGTLTDTVFNSLKSLVQLEPGHYHRPCSCSLDRVA